MRRVAATVVLALALAGCASPRADLQDQIAEVTAVANDGDVTGLLAEARELQSLVDRLEDSGELTPAEATGFRNAAIALQQRAGQLRPPPSPPPAPSPTPEPVETEEEEEEPEPTPEPVETTEAPEPTEEPEPEPTPEPTEDDGGLVPLPTAERTEASEQPGQEPTASPVAVATSAPSTAPGRVRRSPSPAPTSTSPEPEQA